MSARKEWTGPRERRCETTTTDDDDRDAAFLGAFCLDYFSREKKAEKKADLARALCLVFSSRIVT